MKTITCYEKGCGHTFKNDDRDAILKQMYDHYMEVHPNIIPNATEEDKRAWMAQFEIDWAANE